jgi:predicted anti-sigma-YlaC factor YlaD
VTREHIKIFVLDYLAGRMTCKEFVELVTDYLEGSLSFLQRVRLHLHLGLCVGCRVYLRQERQAIKTMGRLPEQPPPPQVREALLQRFRGRNSG